MGLIAIDPNQGNVYRHGCYLWRKDLLLDSVAASARQALFRLPTGCRVIDGFVDVTSADTGTALTATLALENQGADVLLTSAGGVNLAAAGRTPIDVADRGVQTAHNSAGDPVDVVLDILVSTAPGSDGVITVGLFVAREDYDKAT